MLLIDKMLLHTRIKYFKSNWWYTENCTLLTSGFRKLFRFRQYINDKYFTSFNHRYRKTNYYLGITPLLKI
jgi:hypothetical protein